VGLVSASAGFLNEVGYQVPAFRVFVLFGCHVVARC
jgi:hypothetical protein